MNGRTMELISEKHACGVTDGCFEVSGDDAFAYSPQNPERP